MMFEGLRLSGHVLSRWLCPYLVFVSLLCSAFGRTEDLTAGVALVREGVERATSLSSFFASVPASLPFALAGDKPKMLTPLLSLESLLEADAKTDDGDSPPQQGSHFLFLTALNFGQG